jgi:1,4-alpha-glucan branching enzyme
MSSPVNRLGGLLVVATIGCGPAVATRDAGEPQDAATPDASTSVDAGTALPLGAILDATGVTFRLWAPHANAVRVSGDFTEAVMTPIGGSVFEAHVTGVAAGAAYHFSLDVSSGTLERIDPYCRELSGSKCLVVDPAAFVWTSSGYQRPTRAQSIVYELHVGSFAVDAGSAQGTFSSARARLPELADLGVNVIEVMPVQDFGGSGNGWGYNPQLYFAPKPSYGTPEELRALIDEAHKLGIAVWLDLVVNHTDGWTQAPMYCFDGFCPSGTAGIYFFGAGTYARTPWGPRPDFTEPHVQQLLLGSLDQWMTEFHGDGFRWDSISNVRAIDGQGVTPGGKELIQRGNDRIHAQGGVSVAEDLKGYDAITRAVSGGGFGFDSQWDGFGYDVTGVLTNPSDDARDLAVISRALTGGYNGDPYSRLIFLETHDTVGNGGSRITNRIDSAAPTGIYSRRRALLGAALMLTTPAVPMLFMGQEQLATGTFTNPPSPLGAPSAEGAKGRAFFRDLIRLRRNLDGGAGGLQDAKVDVFHRNDPGKVIAYRRYGASGEDVLVVLNFKNHEYVRYDLGVDSAGPWKVRIDSDSAAYGSDFTGGQAGPLTAIAGARDGKPFTLSVRLAPYSAVVLTR